ncbi:MAG: hypothetical protein INR73_08650 [Williamsia sp.]|nr:hypothetical protein [Williamsia sp.]
MELIQNKHYGPVAALKKAFKKQMRLMIILPLLIFATSINDIGKVLTSVLFWSYIAFCLAVIMFSFYNYRIVGRMEGMDGMVKSNLELQVNLLQKRLQWNIIGLRFALLFFVILIEVVPYFQHYRMLDKWHALHPLVRLGAYAALFTLQYFVSRKLSQRKFGNHLMHLEELVKQMQA